MAKSSTVRVSRPDFASAARASLDAAGAGKQGVDTQKQGGSASAAGPGVGAKSGAKSIEVPTINVPGPRKLIRPPLEKIPQGRRNRHPVSFTAAACRPPRASSATAPGDSHAEMFYLQKQAQMQTSMVIVLEDGERIEGVIEWYDRDAIKIRHGGRTLIYKSSIKYLYKSSETRLG